MAKYRRRRSFLSQLWSAIRNLLIVAILLIGGSKIYLYYALKSELKQLQQQAAAFGELQFSDLYTTFKGDVGITGISFFPSQGADFAPIVLDELVVHTPGYLFLLGLDDQRMPNSMGLTARGLDSRLSAWFGLGSEQAVAGVSGNPFEALGCGTVTAFGTADLQRMGFGEALSEASMRYRFAGSNQFQVSVEQTTAVTATTSLNMTIRVPNLIEASNGQALPDVRLLRFDFELDSATFNRRRNEYCAAQNDMTVAAFIDAHMQALGATLAVRGLVADDVFLTQYREYALGNGRWKFLARPVPAIALPVLMSEPPETWLDSLEMSALIGDQIPQALVMHRVAPTPEELAEEEAVEPPEDQDMPPPRARWREVVPSDLVGLIDREVKLTMVTGKEYVGRLLDVSSDGQLSIATRLPGGDAKVPLPIDQVRKAYVASTYADRQ